MIVLTKEEHDFVDDEVKATGLIQKDSEVLQIEDSIFEEFKEVVDHIDFFFPSKLSIVVEKALEKPVLLPILLS